MSRIIIVGAGGIGSACGLLLLKHYGTEHLVTLADIDQKQCDSAKKWIEKGLGRSISSLDTFIIKNEDLEDWNPKGDVLLDCTPGAYCAAVAKVALRNQMQYANLTENVPETKKIVSLVKESSLGFILQTGLAPGFINIFSIKLMELFEESHPDIAIENVKMRVGALSRYASSPAFYAFTWSPVGVSTEYLNDAEVLRNGEVQLVNSLSEREKLIIDGELFEADLTSGGASDLPAFFYKKVNNLDYKTLRYPGHFSWIESLKNSSTHPWDAESLKIEMLKGISYQEEDRVLIYASVKGKDARGSSVEKVRHLEIGPQQLGGIQMSAIQRTTAAALAQSAVLLLKGKINGAVLQSKVPVDEFLTGSFVKEHYGSFGSFSNAIN